MSGVQVDDWFRSDVDVFSIKNVQSCMKVSVSSDYHKAQTCNTVPNLPDRPDTPPEIQIVKHQEIPLACSDQQSTGSDKCAATPDPLSTTTAGLKRQTRQLMIDVHKLNAAGHGAEQEAKVQLVVELGARRPKRAYVNYKQLKADKARSKQMLMDSQSHVRTQTDLVKSKRTNTKKRTC